jgi:hypothetical protein
MDNFIQKEQSILLIGNGPSVFHSRHRDVVDAFDHVVRFNYYEIDGYEDYVGTKTTVWCSHFVRIDRENDVPIGLHLHKNNPPPTTVDRAVWMGKENRKLIKTITSPHYPQGEIEKDRPTTGLVCALYFLEAIKVNKIHLLGFDHFNKRNSKLHHYWNNKAYAGPIQHDGAREAKILSPYKQAGRVVYL